MKKESEQEIATRAIAEEISKFRDEFLDSVRISIEDELAEIEASGYDPARGNGRGPKWLEGV